MSDLLASLPAADRDRLKRTRMPAQPSPILATLTHEPFSCDDWIYERKLDGNVTSFSKLQERFLHQIGQVNQSPRCRLRHAGRVAAGRRNDAIRNSPQ